MRPTAIVLLALLSVLALAQQPQPPQQTPPQQPGAAADNGVKFQSNTQLVVEIVSVKDKSGKIVEGLTAKDFTVTEDGKPQDVKFCEFQRLSDDPLPPIAEPATSAPKSNEKAAKPDLTPVTQHTITPERPGDIRYRDRRLLAIYFDMSAMPVPDQLRALGAAQKFIRTQMTGPDLMAIMVYNEGN